MNKRTRIAVGAATAMIATGGAWSVSSSSSASPSDHRGWPSSSPQSARSTVSDARTSAAGSGSHVLILVEQTVRDASVDVGDSGESPGDYFLFESKLWNSSRTKVVGRDSGRCTLGIRTFVCDATVQIFGKGKIAVYGAFFSETDARIPIIGGTGAYKTAGGQVTVVDQSETTDLLIFEVTD